MDYIKEISPEQAVILWQESRLSLSRCYEKAPEILKVHGSVIGTLGNFSASIGKAKSKKTFNVSAIVAAALKNSTVLRYAAELPEEKRKVLYIDTEQSPYHCLKVMKRILRMAGLPDDRDSGYLEFLALRKYTPGTAHQHCRTGYLPLTGYWAGHHRRHPGYGVRHQQPR